MLTATEIGRLLDRGTSGGVTSDRLLSPKAQALLRYERPEPRAESGEQESAPGASLDAEIEGLIKNMEGRIGGWPPPPPIRH